MVLYHSPGLKGALVKNINLWIKKVTEMERHVGWSNNTWKVKVVRLTENLLKWQFSQKIALKRRFLQKIINFVTNFIIFDKNL